MDLKKKNNLILFTVYRGVNSEGLNFPNDEARMVICVGVPFQNLSDIKVQLKRDFLDELNKKEQRGFGGKEWYREDAMNAVNQSLGRLIRNVNDYGIMICFGIEFLYDKKYLTKWIGNNNIEILNSKKNNKDYYDKLKNFLNNLREKYNNNIINIDDFSSENNRYNDDLDEFYFSDESKELNEVEENSENDNDNEKDKFSFDFEKSNSKYKNPLIGSKRIRYKKDDDDLL